MKKDRTKHKPAGETFVWVTSIGLSLGMLMVVSLLAVIISNGMAVFWPNRIVQIKLKGEPPTYIGGRIVKEQEKIAKALAENPNEDRREWQLFVGNKDTYGQSFQYVDVKDMAQVTHPSDVISMERMEYGDAIGYPKLLEVHNAGSIPFGNSRFLPELQKLVDKVNNRRAEIKKIEKKKIGAINHEMEELRIDRKQSKDPNEVQRMDAKISGLQSEYEVLAKKASDLRAQQELDFLTYKLFSGEEKRLAIGQIIHFYFPNRMGIWGRIRLFLTNIWHFISEEPREANTEGGIFPAIFGTFTMTLLLSIAVTPFGVLAAIYLREYAKQGVFVRSVRIAVNNLAGVPSIVFGVFGLGFLVYSVGGTIDQLFFREYLPTPTFGTGGILWAAFTLALMTVPVVIVATEEALSAVPRGMREGSLACGASKWQTIQRVVLPASASGILTGLILAMARGAGEVAPLMMVGVVKLAPSLPIDSTSPYIHLDQKFMHLGFHIYDLGFQSPDSEAAKPMVFATTLLLILLVVVLNLGAIIIREKLRRKYSTGAF